ncbi:MAG: MFS transporter [Candidatus Eremiobacteraeota bacterium]|nr:MFS transporter [Candidatus Eremiobacteraeota bacterium]
MRIASGASGVAIGLYLASLANRGFHVSTALVGAIGAVAFAAELISVVPMGVASDAIAPRGLMSAGALLGAVGTQLLGMSSLTGLFFVGRAVEGLGAAATTPALLSHFTDVTEGSHSLRARVMTYFELSLLAGLAVGGLAGAELWRSLNASAFTVIALFYVVSAAMLFFSAVESRGYGSAAALMAFRSALENPSLRTLAPVWLCVNAIVGLWLGPTLSFLLTRNFHDHQLLAGVFASHPDKVGWLLFGYALVFGAGLTMWSVILPRTAKTWVMRLALVAMICVCLGLYLLNHLSADLSTARTTVGIATALCIMVESGFTPAALTMLAEAMGARSGRGAAMGIYSVLLGLGAIGGSLLAAVLGQAFAIDGLIYGTFVMAIIGLLLVGRLTTSVSRPQKAVSSRK